MDEDRLTFKQRSENTPLLQRVGQTDLWTCGVLGCGV